MNIVIAGSHSQFKYHLQDKVYSGEISEYDAKTYRYVDDPKELKNLHPEQATIHYWGQYMKNRVMHSRELYVFNRRGEGGK
jgi:hypothetical protein